MKRNFKFIFGLLLLVSVLSVLSIPTFSSTIKEKENNDNIANANSIPLCNTVQGASQTSDDCDYFKVDVANNGYLKLTFNHEYIDSGDYWKIALYKFENGTKEVYSYRGRANEISTETPPIGVDAGTYYIEVYGNYNRELVNIVYNLTIDYEQTEFFESALNDDINGAKDIVFGNTYSGFSQISSDSDYFKLIIPENGYIDILFEHNYINDSGDKWKIILYKFDNKLTEVYTLNCPANQVSTPSPQIGLDAGTYYLNIFGNYDSSLVNEVYGLTINYEQTEFYENTFNNDINGVKSIVFGEVYSGFSQSSTDSDYFKFEISQDSYLNLNFRHEFIDENNDCWKIIVYKFDNKLNEIYRIKCLTKEVSTTSDIVQLEAGTYYVEIYSNYESSVVGVMYNLTVNYTTFADVAPDSWYNNAINYAVNKSLMNGVGDGTNFNPDGPMTRAMVVTVLYRLEGSPSVSSNQPFTDLNADWYADAVAWAYESGVVTGTSSTTFSPDGNVTREQLATILYRYAAYKGYNTSVSADLNVFPDGGNVSSWAKTALSWANGIGLITGASKNGSVILDPQGEASRAQVATILMRFCEKY
ncbi:MAG: S-layer homology domain-containing protein [Clostridia bacterium]|nr:S-layer homology domain-containing protein [Clostridia bacterium]